MAIFTVPSYRVNTVSITYRPHVHELRNDIHNVRRLASANM
jgi:hypothetical protein